MSRREQHVRELAAELGVEVRLNRRRVRACEGSLANNDWDTGHTWISLTEWDGRSQVSYFAALHELGHCALGHLGRNFAEYQRIYIKRTLESEAEAWKWALEHAEEEPGQRVRRCMLYDWLGSYLTYYGPKTAGPTFARVGAQFGITV